MTQFVLKIRHALIQKFGISILDTGLEKCEKITIKSKINSYLGSVKDKILNIAVFMNFNFVKEAFLSILIMRRGPFYEI